MADESRSARLVKALRAAIARLRREPAALVCAIALASQLGLTLTPEVWAGLMTIGTVAVRAIATVTASKEDDEPAEGEV